MEFEGTVFDILPAASGTSARGEWQRQEVVFDIMDGQYTRKVVVTFFNREQDVKALVKGESYVVSINLESREYNGRWYTNVNGWKVQPKNAAPAPAPTPAPAPVAPSTPSYSASATEEVDDLPF